MGVDRRASSSAAGARLLQACPPGPRRAEKQEPRTSQIRARARSGHACRHIYSLGTARPLCHILSHHHLNITYHNHQDLPYDIWAETGGSLAHRTVAPPLARRKMHILIPALTGGAVGRRADMAMHIIYRQGGAAPTAGRARRRADDQDSEGIKQGFSKPCIWKYSAP